ncbi:uncharacterized protein [Panulirus ornatus]|uniref:uncharacterized protein isoform X4 n=1 Tax=Panulirus ornatus TaxID=150431 RepID=UPI003A847D9E
MWTAGVVDAAGGGGGCVRGPGSVQVPPAALAARDHLRCLQTTLRASAAPPTPAPAPSHPRAFLPVLPAADTGAVSQATPPVSALEAGEPAAAAPRAAAGVQAAAATASAAAAAAAPRPRSTATATRQTRTSSPKASTTATAPTSTKASI